MRARIVLEEVCHSNAQGSPIVPIVMAKGVEQTIALALMGLKHALGAACAMKTRMFSRIPKKKQKNLLLVKTKENSSKAWGLISRISALPQGNPDGVSLANYFVLQFHDMNESRTQPL